MSIPRRLYRRRRVFRPTCCLSVLKVQTLPVQFVMDLLYNRLNNKSTTVHNKSKGLYGLLWLCNKSTANRKSGVGFRLVLDLLWRRSHSQIKLWALLCIKLYFLIGLVVRATANDVSEFGFGEGYDVDFLWMLYKRSTINRTRGVWT